RRLPPPRPRRRRRSRVARVPVRGRRIPAIRGTAGGRLRHPMPIPVDTRALRAALLGASVALVCAAPSPLLAQPAQPAAQEDPSTAKAQQLFIEGREAMKKNDFARGLELLSQSQQIHPSAGTLLNVAACEEQLGKTASAWQNFSLVMSQLP